jgi:nicotinamide-nucleotide amidase
MTSEINLLAAEVLALTSSKGLTLVSAESCTAGLLTEVLANTPGAGGTFLGGIVCYDKRFKNSVLRVPKDVLRTHTAVSQTVVAAMANGALEASGANLAVAITGVAGPDRDEDDNPVGLVFICVSGSNGHTGHARLELGYQDVALIKESAVIRALSLAREALIAWQHVPEIVSR